MSEAHHLPPELTSFVGREAELAAVAEAVVAGRLLTLVGPGGCGKTRLAARTAVRQAPEWPDGVWWVDLAAESDADAVAARVADALGVLVPGEPQAPAAVLAQLRHRALLLVLDNCEHVLPGVARLAAAVLERCPDVGLLATSQATIGVSGERVWRVPPLSLADALALFLDRAGAQSVDGPAHTAARRVCDRLDRLPLAVELAAGWAGTLSPAQIAESLAEPFTLLTGGPRNAPFRQQTLESSLRWSHDLLDDEERALFRRLGAFEPGFTADAARRVCATPPLDEARTLCALRGLIDESLVIADTGGPAARYRMLDVIRRYALVRLEESGEADRTHDRHLDAYLDLAEGLLPLLDTDKDAWRREVGADYANVRAAIARGLSREDTERGRRLAVATAWLWHLEARGAEGLRLLRRAVDRAGDEQSGLQARVLAAVALVADTAEAGEEGYAAAAAAEVLASRFGDAATVRWARLLGAIGTLGRDLGTTYERAVDVRDDARRAGDRVVADHTQVLVGLVHLVRDEDDRAIGELGAALEGLLARHDRGVAATALACTAVASTHRGRLADAADLAGRAVATAQPLRDFHRVGSALSVLAEVRALQGDLDAAQQALEPVRKLIDDSGLSPFIPGWERAGARLALWSGRPDLAVQWCRREGGAPSADDALTPDTQVVLAAALRLEGEQARAHLLVAGVEKIAEAMAMPRVRADSVEQRAHLLADDDPDAAVAAHHESLRLRTEHGLVLGCVDSLEALALMACRRDAVEFAAVLLGAAERARAESGYAAGSSRHPLLDDPAVGEAVARGREMDLRAAAAYAGRARGARGRPTSGWGSLTPTEREVVELAVQGLSNPEIGTRLFMSRGTVKTHLAHVYAKLAVANRTELARLATREHAPRS
ncbi:helix-turn-helix transcriptional regulator [Pseudonocardia nigra]|uniref:helix-turn-helix transcriptional regulator n=1 Tax=Pseudonocardia nigra TaxID=1921578 RepID=UPI001C5FB06D|nr:LuxR C-terminal-related transcriptional regulator [Pseudonocardia nigra]